MYMQYYLLKDHSKQDVCLGHASLVGTHLTASESGRVMVCWAAMANEAGAIGGVDLAVEGEVDDLALVSAGAVFWPSASRASQVL